MKQQKNVSWTEPFALRHTVSVYRELALLHASLASEEYSSSLVDLLDRWDWKGLCSLELDYRLSGTPEETFHARQALAFFTKLEPLDIGVDKRQAAVDKFMEAEASCRQTNEIFRLRARGEFSFSPRVEAILFRAQQKIAHCLGDIPSLEVLKMRFGPGATTLTKKRNASVVEKLQAGISCSEDVLPWASTLLEELPHIAFGPGSAYYSRLSDREVCARVPVIVSDGVIEFVPKNSKTYRSISKEGSLNTLIQLALGDLMTERLLRVGVDIRDQSINQELARKGSIDGSFATIDLSSASDTISTELVYNLLPIDWALLLDRSRSSHVLLDDERIALEKFSSMGNGFTFPLETLIFWALSSSVDDREFASVYGDDIIVHSESVQEVFTILTTCGFSVNPTKSFWQGPFRESCGADYITGFDVRPCYCKKLLSMAELFRLHNFYVRKSEPEFASAVLQWIPDEIRLWGPDGFGDGHLIGDWSARRPPQFLRSGYGGVLFDTYTYCGRRDIRPNREGDRVLPLYAIYIRENGDDVTDVCQPKTLGDLISFLRIRRKNILALAPLEIPERVSPVDGRSVKAVSYPGVEGYKKVSIYTFDRA